MSDVDELEKIELIRERTHLSYAAAKQLLEEAGGDVLEALILQEERDERERRDDQRVWEGRGKDLFDKVRELLKEGNIRQLTIKKGEQEIFRIPVAAGVVGAAIAPYLALLGGVVALASRYSIHVERVDARDGAAGGERGSARAEPPPHAGGSSAYYEGGENPFQPPR